MSPLSPTVVTSEETASRNIDCRYADNEEHESESVEKRKKKTKAFIWKDDMIFFLINMWKQESVLFNNKDPSYSDKRTRGVAMERIYNCMLEKGYNPMPTKEDLHDKMNNLRVYFNVQKNKVESSKGSGGATSSVFKPTWKFYDELEFVRDMVNARKTFSNIGEDEDLLMESISGSRRKDRKKSQPIPNPAVDVMKEATSVLKNLSQRTNSLGDSDVPSTVTSQSKSLDDFFGETIGKLMQEIPDGMNKDMLKLEIQNLIYKTKYLPPPPAHSVQSHATYPAHALATYQAQTPAPSHQTRVPTASYMAQSPRPSHMAQQPGSSYMTQSPGTPQSGQPTRAGAVTPS